MLLTHAYRALGYELTNQRQDWSAENPEGVCLALWREEMFEENGSKIFDLWALHKPGKAWERKSGHQKRIMHLVKALREHDGRVDVIELDGPAGGPYTDAHPWHPKEHGGAHWRIEQFDRRTGYFRVSAKVSG